MADDVHVMIVDDEEGMLEWLSILLEQNGYTVSVYPNGEAALKGAKKSTPDIAIVDIKMPGMSGLELLEKLREKSPDVIGIVMTAFSSVDSAIDAIRKGASDYLIKPFEVDQLLIAIERGMENLSLKKENKTLKLSVRKKFSVEGIIGKAESLIELLEKVRVIADKDATVLITGETGTGKELIAKAIHYSSSRADRPFLGVNCGSFTKSLLESELFGHMKGSFTGAHKDKKGLLVAAEGGTFFLDEVGELDRELQVKVLRALQDKQVLPVGGTKYVPFDARIVAATNVDIHGMVRDKSFRADLYYRLNVIPLHVPPLRERSEDIPLLVEYFVFDHVAEGETPRLFSEASMELLINYKWPGNIWELENLVERLCIMTSGDTIEVEDIPESIREMQVSETDTEEAPTINGTSPTLEEVEKAYTMYVLDYRAKGNKRQAARILGIDESTLHRRLKRYSE